MAVNVSVSIPELQTSREREMGFFSFLIHFWREKCQAQFGFQRGLRHRRTGSTLRVFTLRTNGCTGGTLIGCRATSDAHVVPVTFFYALDDVQLDRMI